VGEDVGDPAFFVIISGAAAASGGDAGAGAGEGSGTAVLRVGVARGGPLLRKTGAGVTEGLRVGVVRVVRAGDRVRGGKGSGERRYDRGNIAVWTIFNIVSGASSERTHM
jgi:hypothetical protein